MHLSVVQLAAVLGQCGVQELVLLRGLDHATSAEGEGGKPSQRFGRSSTSGQQDCDQPVQAKLTHRLQDVHLLRLPQLLAADAAGDEAARPPDTRAEGKSTALLYLSLLLCLLQCPDRFKIESHLYYLLLVDE